VAGDAEKDHAALMETRSELRAWEQSTWPEDDFTVEANREDLAGLEQRHADRRAFTYTVLTPDGRECLGCVYVFPPGASFLAKAEVRPVRDDTWADVNLAVYFWARRSQMDSGMDGRLLAALRPWFAAEWQADRVVFVTSEQFAEQVALIRSAGLVVKFELIEPDKPGTFLVFG
jgi:hypothetical protein